MVFRSSNLYFSLLRGLIRTSWRSRSAVTHTHTQRHTNTYIHIHVQLIVIWQNSRVKERVWQAHLNVGDDGCIRERKRLNGKDHLKSCHLYRLDCKWAGGSIKKFVAVALLIWNAFSKAEKWTAGDEVGLISMVTKNHKINENRLKFYVRKKIESISTCQFDHFRHFTKHEQNGS